MKRLILISNHNRSRHNFSGSKNPKEDFSGNNPKVGHFRIFGCLTYPHVYSKKRTKLEPMIKKGICVGYEENLKSYYIFIHMRKLVVVRWDVKFEEDKSFKKSCELEKGDQQDPTIQECTL